MINRAFFCANIPSVGNSAFFSKDESKHIFKVLRGKIGDKITLINGNGISAVGEIIGDNTAKIISVQKHIPPTPFLSLYVSPPRHSGMDTIIAFCSETSVREIIPIICENSVSIPSPDSCVKWNKKIIESCKQARNPFFPSVSAPVKFKKALEAAEQTEAFFGSPCDDDFPMTAISSENTKKSWFVGPEGGFSESEILLMKSKSFKPLRLSPVIMRIETAALAGIICLSNSKQCS